MKKFAKFLKKTSYFIIFYLIADILFMKLLPTNIKNKIYDKKSHKIKSYYYHHDLRPNSFWTEKWGPHSYKIYTNNYGFKDKKIRKVQFKENNILFIGDSFTEGVGVNYENTFVGIIDKKISLKNKNYEILNAGLISYSPIVILSKLNHILNIRKLPINKVFVILSNGDFHDDIFRYNNINDDFVVSHDDFYNSKILVNLNNFIKSNTIFYQLFKKIFPLSNLISDFEKKQIESKTQYSKEQILQILNSKPDHQHVLSNDAFLSWGQEGLKKSTLYMQKIYDLLDEKNIDLTLIVIEEAIFVLNELDSSFYENHWKNFSEKNKIDFIFLKNYHRNYTDKFIAYKDLFFIGDNHFNEKGNKLIADEILRKSNFIKKTLN
tara:strand:+ start:92 stop:1225 length:1134 start_codon:yes stop_codon:yes gene_type:complete